MKDCVLPPMAPLHLAEQRYPLTPINERTAFCIQQLRYGYAEEDPWTADQEKAFRAKYGNAWSDKLNSILPAREKHRGICIWTNPFSAVRFSVGRDPLWSPSVFEKRLQSSKEIIHQMQVIEGSEWTYSDLLEKLVLQEFLDFIKLPSHFPKFLNPAIFDGTPPLPNQELAVHLFRTHHLHRLVAALLVSQWVDWGYIEWSSPQWMTLDERIAKSRTALLGLGGPRKIFTSNRQKN